MPLLDAALAFALTMLALSSLVGMIQEWLHQVRQARNQQLTKMIEQFFERHLIPVARKRLDAGAEDLSQARQALDQRLQQLDGSNVRAAEKQTQSWIKLFGLENLLNRVKAQRLTHVPDEELLASVKSSEAIQEWAGRLNQDTDQLLEELQNGWKDLSRQFTERFRRQAKTSATYVGLLLAFVLNIDSLHLLSVYMSDDDARSAIAAFPEPGRSAPADNGAESAVRIRQQLRTIQTSAFPVGWNLFPNCPPASTDPRCVHYWVNAKNSFELAGLSFEQRQQINPAQHPRRALGLFLSDAESGRPTTPVPTAAHMSTDGGPATAGAPATSAVDPALLGRLPLWSLLGWMLGCTLTGLLAGQGSPFWIEVVRRLSVTRDRLRSERRDTKSNAATQTQTGQTEAGQKKSVETPPTGGRSNKHEAEEGTEKDT